MFDIHHVCGKKLSQRLGKMALLLLLDFFNFRFHAQGTIVEGVGDEVLIGLASTLGLIALVSLLYNTQGGQRNIHPSQAENVRIVRDRLGVGGQEGSDTAGSEGPVLPDPPPVTYSHDRICPVCLTDAKFCTTTNCGHIFCGMYMYVLKRQLSSSIYIL